MAFIFNFIITYKLLRIIKQWVVSENGIGVMEIQNCMDFDFQAKEGTHFKLLCWIVWMGYQLYYAFTYSITGHPKNPSWMSHHIETSGCLTVKALTYYVVPAKTSDNTSPFIAIPPSHQPRHTYTNLTYQLPITLHLKWLPSQVRCRVIWD